MKSSGQKNKKCPACGRQFICHGDDDCWCEQIRLNPPELKLIMLRYTDCLCPDCLKAYESK